MINFTVTRRIVLDSKEEEANQSANYNARMMANQQNNGGFAPPPDMNVSNFFFEIDLQFALISFFVNLLRS